MLDEKLPKIKEFIKSYIETYQTSLNTTNPIFSFKLVNLSTKMQDSFFTSFMSNSKGSMIRTNVGLEKYEDKRMRKT